MREAVRLPAIDVHVTPADIRATLRNDVRTGLARTPKELPAKWFYDERGSELFAEITRLPEYYLTRREREILEARAPEIAAVTSADTLVELGSGAAEKTRLLLDALSEAGTLGRFVPLDVSEAFLRTAAQAIAEDYPGLEVHALVADFERHLGAIPRGGTRLVALLGSTIGNLEPGRRGGFLAAVQATLAPGDSLLLGVDLVKDVGRLEAAYNDAAGVTAAFNLNVLSVLDRELGADFDPARFEHAARWNPAGEWIEMFLRSTVEQKVRIPVLGLLAHFAAGEELRTEISAKFRRERIEAELLAAGLEPARWWTDAAGDFGLSLSFRR